MTSLDNMLRAMTDDATFRAITLDSTNTVRGTLASQEVKGETARHLADLAIGTALIRETMAPNMRVQGLLKNKAGGYLLGDSHPSGDVRGLISLQKTGGEFTLKKSLLQLMRTLQNGKLHQGVVEVPEAGGVTAALMVYMQESEQITTMIATGATFNGEPSADNLERAGGYLIQLLPGGDNNTLAVMTARLENDFSDFSTWLKKDEFSARHLLKELFYGMPFTELGDSSIRYNCWCSQASMMGALASLDRTEVKDMIDAGKTLDITCDYCRTDYQVSPAELRGLTGKQN